MAFMKPPILSHQSEIPDSVPTYIFVDNRLAINIAVGRACASWCQGLAQLTRTKLKQLGQSRRIYLFWVPGHADVEGNELSDKSAKYASAGHSCFGKPPARFTEPSVEAAQRAPVASDKILDFLKAKAAAAVLRKSRVRSHRPRVPPSTRTPNARYMTRSRSRRNHTDRSRLDNNTPT